MLISNYIEYLYYDFFKEECYQQLTYLIVNYRTNI